MPFLDDLLPKTNLSSTREGNKRALREAYSNYKEANARGLHSIDCYRAAFVYAMCCMHVARLLRVVTNRQTVGVTIYFLSVSAQKLEEVIRLVENRIALEARDGQAHALAELIKQLSLAKQVRGRCTEGTIDVLVTAAGNPSIQREPGFDARVQAFQNKPWRIDPRVDKVVEHILREVRDCSSVSSTS